MTIERVFDGVGVLPVLTIHDASIAVDLARALLNGGLATIEVTLRTPEATRAIHDIRNALPEVIVGAGSVMNSTDSQSSVAAGASFLVSPGFDRDVVMSAEQDGVPYIPGVATASEMQAAWNAGVRVMKVFPAEHIGGVRLIDSFAQVWPYARFVPTGGIRHNNAEPYLAHPAVLAVGGSWMATPDDIARRDWARITDSAAAASALRKSDHG